MPRKRSRSENYEDHIAIHHTLQPVTFIEEELILVWRFPVDISQSSIGGRTTLSNACTLIALKIAELVHIHDIKMPIPYPTRNDRVAAGAERTQRKHYIRSSADETVVDNNGFETTCPPRLIGCLINGIVDGNDTYSKHAGDESTRNYNLPDAIKACDLSFSEVDFKLTTGSIKESLPKLIKMAVRHPLFQSESRLVFIMMSCVRTVSIIFDRNQDTLTLFDAHQHYWPDNKKTYKHGALIGTCSYSNLHSFAKWIENFVYPDVADHVNAFEISLIRITEAGTNKAQGVCKYPDNKFTTIRTPVFQAMNLQEDKENCRSEIVGPSSSPRHSLQTPNRKMWSKTTTRLRKWGKRIYNKIKEEIA